MSSLYVTALVAIALIQGPAAPSNSAPTSPQGAQPPTPAVTAKQYLDNAKQALSGVAGETLPKDAQKVFSQLQSDFAGLSSAYSTSQPPLQDAKPTDIEGVPPDWMTRFYDVERDLALLIGGGAMLPPTTASSLLSPEDVPDISLLAQKDPSMATRTALERFRVQLELFYDATGRGGLVAAIGDD